MKLSFFRPERALREDSGPWLEDPSFGISNYSQLFKIMSAGVFFLDRTHTISTPFHTHNLFKLDLNSQKAAHLSYGDISVKRAKEILELSKKLMKPISLFYSGGIDSTTSLISFLLAENNWQNLKEQLIVYLSPESISENPDFYNKFIRGHFRTRSSYLFFECFDKNSLVVSGEGNDQLFGSDIGATIVKKKGTAFLFEKFSDQSLNELLSIFPLTSSGKNNLQNVFSMLAKQSPSGIDNIFEFVWWLNFTCKWQNVFIRMLSFANRTSRKNIDQAFIDNYYHCFFMTKDFETWSIWNKDIKIQDNWKKYKFEAKKFIFDFTKDKYYFENKVKVGSLFNIIVQQPAALAIDNDYTFHDELDFSKFLNPKNSFSHT